MKLILQRVTQASVAIDNKTYSQINQGLVVFLGIHQNDNKQTIEWLVNKLVNLRIFSDSEAKMNLSVIDIKGEILLISQFTLYADSQKGNRPGFTDAAKPDIAIPLYEAFIKRLESTGITVKTGQFGAHMDISLINSGPVTIILER